MPEDYIDELDDQEQASGLLLVELHPKARTVAGRPGGSRIFHEFDERHPHNGEALVVAGRVVKVFPTIRVRRAIAEGLLRDVTGRKEATPVPLDLAEIIDAQGRNGVAPATPAEAQTAATETTESATGKARK